MGQTGYFFGPCVIAFLLTPVFWLSMIPDISQFVGAPQRSLSFSVKPRPVYTPKRAVKHLFLSHTRVSSEEEVIFAVAYDKLVSNDMFS